MFKICELWTVILWYELNPRVRCAFGNVLIVHPIRDFLAKTFSVDYGGQNFELLCVDFKIT